MRVTIESDNKWRTALLKFCKSYQVKAGILEGATSVTGDLIAPYAACNEFGTANIPARPFMRRTMNEHEQDWVDGFGALLAAVGPEKAAMAVGKRMAEDIQAMILSNMPPPNSPATMQRKALKEGPRGTLVDTGSMVKAVEFEVQKC